MARLTYVWVRWQALLDEVASVPLESEVARFLLAGIQARDLDARCEFASQWGNAPVD